MKRLVVLGMIASLLVCGTPVSAQTAPQGLQQVEYESPTPPDLNPASQFRDNKDAWQRNSSEEELDKRLIDVFPHPINIGGGNGADSAKTIVVDAYDFFAEKEKHFKTSGQQSKTQIKGVRILCGHDAQKCQQRICKIPVQEQKNDSRLGNSLFNHSRLSDSTLSTKLPDWKWNESKLPTRLRDSRLPDAKLERISKFRVVTKTPSGPVQFVRYITIIFSSPVVPESPALYRQKGLPTVPAIISPRIPGTWQWIDSCTAVFETGFGQAPSATKYTVTIPATTKSLDGKSLGAPVVWNFTTPEPEPDHATGDPDNGSYVPVDFRQPINKQSAFKKIHMVVANKEVPLRSATDEELAHYMRDYKNSNPSFIALVPITYPPPNLEGYVAVEPGVLSAEGSICSLKGDRRKILTGGAPLSIPGLKQNTNVLTWAPSKVEKVYEPGEAWEIAFSGPSCNKPDETYTSIDASKIRPEMFSISPPMANLKFYAQSSAVLIRGDSQANTTYNVTISGSLPGFKCTLGHDQTVQVKVGSTQAQLIRPSKSCFVIDPNGPKVFPIQSMNTDKVRVLVYSADKALDALKYWPTDLSTYTGIKLLSDQTMALKRDDEHILTTNYDLTPFYNRGEGRLLIQVSQLQPSLPLYIDHRYDPICHQYQVWTQLTDLNLNAVTVHGRTVQCYGVDRHSGQLIAQIAPIAPNCGDFVKTAIEGIYQNPPEAKGQIAAIAAKSLAGPSMLLLSNADIGSASLPEEPAYLGYASTDQSICRGGEEVHFYGWLRVRDHDALKLVSAGDVHFELLDSQSHQLDQGTVQLTASGAFSGVCHLGLQPSEGFASLSFNYVFEGKVHPMVAGSSIRVVSNTPARTQLSIAVRPGRTIICGERASVGVQLLEEKSRVLKEPITIEWRARPVRFCPKGWETFRFGHDFTWKSSPPNPAGIFQADASTATDLNGCAAYSFETRNMSRPEPILLDVSAYAHAKSDNPVLANTSLVVHPAGLCVGVKAKPQIRSFDETTVDLDFVVTDLAGATVPNTKVQFRILERGGKSVTSQLLVEQTALSGANPQRIQMRSRSFKPVSLIASVSDSQGRISQTRMDLLENVAGGEPTSKQRLVILPDKESYEPGQTCRLFVESPFAQAEGILVADSQTGMVSKKVSFSSNHCVIELPVNSKSKETIDGMIKVYDRADLAQSANLGQNVGTLQSARGAVGFFRCNVSPAQDPNLSVSIDACTKDLEAGSSSKFIVQVKDSQGQAAVNAELAVTATENVDAIDITPGNSYILRAFASEYYSSINSTSMDALTEPELKSKTDIFAYKFHFKPTSPPRVSAPSGLFFNNHIEPLPPENTSCFCTKIIHCDAKGQAQVSIPIDARSKCLQVSAIAASADGTKFGTASEIIECARALQVSITPPMVVYDSDEFTLPVHLTNFLSHSVNVNIEASQVSETPKRIVSTSIAASSSIQVCIKNAGHLPPDAALKVLSGTNRIAIPCAAIHVQTEGTSELIASGRLAQTLNIQVEASIGRVLSNAAAIASNNISGLVAARAEDLLLRQPTTTDDIASRLITLTSLRTLLLDSPSAQAKRYDAIIDTDRKSLLVDFDRLSGHRYWIPNDQNSSSVFECSFTSAHQAQALCAAAFAQADQQKLATRLDIDSLVYEKFPTYKTPKDETIMDSVSYSAYVASLVPLEEGQNNYRQMTAADGVLRELKVFPIERFSDESLAWLLLASKNLPFNANFSASIKREFLRSAEQVPTECSEEELWMFHSSLIRKESAKLMALLGFVPQSKNIAKLAESICKKLKEGNFRSDSDIAFAAMALVDYVRATKDCRPAKMAVKVDGATTNLSFGQEPGLAGVPTKSAPREIEIDGEPDGRFNIAIAHRLSTRTQANPLSAGFAVQRTFAPAEGSKVWQDSSGAWHVKIGSRVKSVITFVPYRSTLHAVLTDPLCGGLVTSQDALRLEPIMLSIENVQWANWEDTSRWVQHSDLDTSCVRTFGSDLVPTLYRFEYPLYASTVGSFFVPPCEVRNPFDHQFWGRSASAQLIVDP